MIFEKDTIMGQILLEINENEYNKVFINEIDNLILKIGAEEYNYYEGPLWNKDGLKIVPLDEKVIMNKNTIIIKTDFSYEFSWLVTELEKIYQPTKKASYRLYSTIGYLFNIYSEKFDDLEVILRMVSMFSLIWLHPDHIGQDKFIIRSISLPNFGKDF